MIAEIIINTTAKRLQQTFTYAVPQGMDIHVGSRVLVPFGTRKEEGIVIAVQKGTGSQFSFTIKPILAVLSTQNGFQEEMIQTALWIHSYYLCSLADALRLFMVKKKGITAEEYYLPTTASCLLSEKEQCVFTYIQEHGSVSKSTLQRKFSSSILDALLAKGCICIEKKWKNKVADKKEKWLQFVHDDTEDILAHRRRQSQLLQDIKQAGEMSCQEAVKKGYSTAVIRNLSATGLIRVIEKTRRTSNLLQTLPADDAVVLTEEQQAAIAAVRNDTQGDTYVLHGITGSGKTEIYMQLAADVLQQGKQVFVLVPEIALTGQIVRRFIRRFGADVIVMHSQLSKGERQNNWLRMLRGESHICIGARSAIFTAAKSIGLIIVDESHDASYKQEESPRYHAVAVARKRAAYYHCPVILGSATPSIADYYRAKTGEYHLLELKKRVKNHPLPQVTVVDMRDELARGNYRVVSDALLALLEKTLKAKQQAIILLNRRGFSTFVMCRKCGYVVKCDTCDVPMVYHKQASQLRCHYCEAEKPIPVVCPSCGSKYIKFFGTGTEKVEEQLHELLPSARIIRLDQDTTSRKNSGDHIIESFRRHKYDILLGTQMVAKGHDFANVRAVGILSADSLLNLPAYWAGERTFQLLTQAAGRAGRGTIPGEVIMQTYAPEHYVIQYAEKQDYPSFYKQEIEFREAFLYPPFHHIIKLIITDEDETLLWQKGNDIAKALQHWNTTQAAAVEITDPYVDIIKKIRNKYRIIILIKGKDVSAVKRFIRQEPLCWQTGVIIDVDPAF